jgi:hypothetical protein
MSSPASKRRSNSSAVIVFSPFTILSRSAKLPRGHVFDFEIDHRIRHRFFFFFRRSALSAAT